MRQIPVQSRDGVSFALVDDADYARFSGVRWFLLNGYAARKLGGTTVYMHRRILGLSPGDGLQCDHINRDRLDNRRENLRAVTQQRNLRNLGSKPGSTSRYRGVWYRRDRGTWGAQAKFEDKTHCLGTFASEEAAAEAVNEFWTSQGYEAPNQISRVAA